jgi:RNA polymerase sigma-70 factor (ECF subfamily)
METMPSSDLRLLEEWRSRRDADAFREIVSRHASMVYATARRLLGNPADAEDVAQDCFARLATDDAIRIKSSLSGWLHHLAVGRSREYLRSETRRRGRESRAAARVAAAHGGPSTLEAILPLVDEAIDELADDLRDVLVGHYLEGESYEAIAARLGMSRRAATYRAQKAIRRVRRRLRASGVRVASAALAAALASGRMEAAPVSLHATLGKVAVAGFRTERSGALAEPPAAGARAAAAGTGFGAAKAAGAALAILALGAGAVLHSLHRDGAEKAPPPGATGGAVETAATPRAPAPAESAAGVEPGAAPADPQATPALLFVITGRVTDSVSGEPLPGAQVEIGFEKDFADTDAGGRYRLEVGPGRHEIIAAAPGYARGRANARVTEPGETVVDLALDPTVEVVVRVADTEGSPLPGVTVTPSETEDGGGVYDNRNSAVTDLRGEATVLRNSRFGPHRPLIQARREGYSQKEVSDIETGSDGKARVAIILEDLARNARAITGRVTDSGGDPVPGALVTWNDGSVSYGPDGVVRKETAETDEDGRYRLEFRHRESRFSFVAHARGFAPAWVQEVLAGAGEAPATLDFVLEPGRVVEGEVAGEDGELVPGAKVAVRGSPGGFWNLEDILSTVPHTATTDERGRFAIADVAEGFVSLEVEKSGWSSASLDGLPTGEVHQVTLYRPGVVRCRVVGLDEKPVTVFTVKVDTGHPGHSSEGTAFTSTEGRFTIEGLRRDAGGPTFTFRIESEGYAPAYLRGVKAEPENEAREHVVKLGKPTELAGKVIDAATGKPLPDVSVCAGVPRSEELGWIDWMLQNMQSFSETRTDDEGSFRFEEGEPLTLFVRAPGYRRQAVTPAMRPERSDPGAPGSGLEIALERGESIAGTFAAFPGGKKPRGAGLICLREAGAPGEPAVRDPYGFHALTPEKAGTSFAWDDLHPGRYLVFFDIPGEVGTTTERIYHRVELREGSRESVRLGEDLGDLSFEGRLLDADGRPLLQASLIVRPLFAWEVELECHSHDRKGSFAFRHLKHGRYALEASRYRDAKRQALELEPIIIDADTRRDLTVEW